MTRVDLHCGDCLEIMRGMPDRSVDLVFTSPPYEAARTYGIGYKLRGQDWVDWCVPRFMECLRVCRGLVAWNVEGQTRAFRWSATPVLLMAELHRNGIHLRKPPVFARVGIPGSGGPDWLRNDYEFVVCATNGGKLPWSDNTAMGHPPKWAPGGAMSHRQSSGARVNQWGGVGGPNGFGKRFSSKKPRPSHKMTKAQKVAAGGVLHTKRVSADKWGGNDVMETQCYLPPVLANPGNIIKINVGGGVIGSALAHENEAPFPEDFAEFFIRSFCPPGGTVLDPFLGSGTTVCVAKRTSRNGIGIDVRQSQIDLTQRRLGTVQVEIFD